MRDEDELTQGVKALRVGQSRRVASDPNKKAPPPHENPTRPETANPSSSATKAKQVLFLRWALKNS